jgi:hypothetical protein
MSLNSPPTFENTFEDCQHVIRRIAKIYADPTCAPLNEEDLISEGNRKLTELINKSTFTRFAHSRPEFFRFFKTTVNNHVKGLVVRHRCTVKRGGVKQAPGAVGFDRVKQIDMSIDDDDSCLQLPVLDTTSEMSELIEDVQAILTPVERLVFDQLLEPGPTAWILAMFDMERAAVSRGAETLEVKIRPSHLAGSLGMTREEYARVERLVKEKVMNHMENPDDNIRLNTAVATLSAVFELQVPPETSAKIIARLFTVAARQHYNRVKDNDDVKALLRDVGAIVPGLVAENLNCFGVLHHPQNRICCSCARNAECAVATANVGLNEITLSPKLVRSKHQRIPVAGDGRTVHPPVSVVEVVDDVQSPEERRDEIVHYLSENFRPICNKTDVYFRHKDKLAGNRVRYVFCMNRKHEVRFCVPSESLKTRLEYRKTAWYIPSALTAQEAIRLLARHADETFTRG